MYPLQAHDQHRAIMFVEDRSTDLDRVVGADREEEAVEGRVVELAERHAIADQRFALGIPVGDDVSGVEQFLMSQAAKGAPLLVRPDDALTEDHLMNALSDGARDVGTSGLVAILRKDMVPGLLSERVCGVVDLDRER